MPLRWRMIQKGSGGRPPLRLESKAWSGPSNVHSTGTVCDGLENVRMGLEAVPSSSHDANPSPRMPASFHHPQTSSGGRLIPRRLAGSAHGGLGGQAGQVWERRAYVFGLLSERLWIVSQRKKVERCVIVLFLALLISLNKQIDRIGSRLLLMIEFTAQTNSESKVDPKKHRTDRSVRFGAVRMLTSSSSQSIDLSLSRLDDQALTPNDLERQRRPHPPPSPGGLLA